MNLRMPIALLLSLGFNCASFADMMCDRPSDYTPQRSEELYHTLDRNNKAQAQSHDCLSMRENEARDFNEVYECQINGGVLASGEKIGVYDTLEQGSLVCGRNAGGFMCIRCYDDDGKHHPKAESARDHKEIGHAHTNATS